MLKISNMLHWNSDHFHGKIIFHEVFESIENIYTLNFLKEFSYDYT